MEQELTQLLRELAAQLGTTTEYLWAVLIKQALLEGLKSFVFVAVTVGVLLSIKPAWGRLKWDDYGELEDKQNSSLTWAIVASVAGLFMSIGLIFAIQTAIDALMNPEYWALKEILYLI